MVSDGIKAAQIQAQYSPLINSTWAASSTRLARVRAAIKHAAARLNPPWRGHRPAGRHAAPGRSFPAATRRAYLISVNTAAVFLAGRMLLAARRTVPHVVNPQHENKRER